MTATDSDYFESLWAGSEDPWDQVDRFSEQRKFDLTTAILPKERYRSGFEPGCGTGSLTNRLAARVDLLLAADRYTQAVVATTDRCGCLPTVEVRQLDLARGWPSRSFDLIVLSEVLYYFEPATIAQILRRAELSLEPGGHLVACHYRPFVPEHAVRGDDVHHQIRRVGWRPAVEHRESDFLLEVFEQ